MNGGNSDYIIVKNVFENVKKVDVGLVISFFKDIFFFENKKNKEMIFIIYNGKDEYEMWGGYYRMRLIFV